MREIISPLDGFRSPFGFARGGFAPFSPASLFAMGEQGVWYDPSDMTTLFQDSAGTTPVTAVEQPVGRMLDKSGRGNHATQATSAARPVLSARVNLLTKTEEFQDAVWVKTGSTVSANTTETTDPLGGNAADKLIESASTSEHRLLQSIVKAASISFVAVIYAKASERTRVAITCNLASNGAYAVFDLLGGQVGVPATTYGSGFSGASASITFAGNGWYRCQLSFTSDVNTSLDVRLQLDSGTGTGPVSTTYAGNGTSGVYIWGADLRVSNDGVNLPAYQRVNTATDYDTTGFPMYLRFDGVDDFMATASINPGAIDKAQVFAGARKLSNAAGGMIVETGAGVGEAGTLGLANPVTSAAGLWFRSRGSFAATVIQSGIDAAPITDSLCGLADISAPSLILRRNGTAFLSDTTTAQGPGNYGTYPLYIGSRAGASLRYNGRLYPLIVRFGANLTDTQINQTEQWVSGQMGGGYYPTGYDFLVDASGNQITDASDNPLYTQALYT